MVAEQIEKIKQEYTDKYVVVDPGRPELARFREHVGRVRTVNMSGRALVEFVDYHLNIGWYDIDLDYLKVVDKPPPKEKKPEAKKPTAKPAAKQPAAPAKKPAAAGGEKKMSALEMARAQGAAGKGGAAAAPAKKQAADKPAKADRSKMSVAEMLAAARAEKSDSSAAAPAPAEAAPAAAEPEPAPEPAAEAEAPAESAAGGVVKVDRSSMSVADMLAYCREKDAQ